MKRALLVTFDPPPHHDWRQYAYHAILDGYDEDDPYGHGPTPHAAVRELAELRRQLAEIRCPDDPCAELRRMRGIE